MLLNSQLNLKKQRKDFNKEIKTELLMQRLQSNLPNKDYWHVLVQDLDKVVELMVTYLKENNFNSIQKRLTKEKNDFICINIIIISNFTIISIKFNS